MLQPITSTVTRKSLPVVVFLLVAVLLGVKLIPIAYQNNLLLIVSILILMFAGTVSYSLYYLSFNSPDAENGGFLQTYKHEIMLVAVLVITTLPLLTQAYFYYDDWWGIGNGRSMLNVENVIKYGRPMQIMIFEALNKISIRNAYLFKWVFLSLMILYSLLLYRWLRIKTENRVLSFYVACILSVFPPVMDVLGYTSTSPISFSLVSSVLSIICLDCAFLFCRQRKKIDLMLNLFLGLLFLFIALLSYQIGPQIFFLFLTIELYFNFHTANILRKHLIILFFFGLMNGFYLLFIKLLSNIYLVGIITNRSQPINSLSQISDKAHFYKLILEQSVRQIIAAFTGSSFFTQRYRGYFISFSDERIGTFLSLIIVLFVLIAFLSYWHRTRSFVGLVMLLAYIPASYFVFLVLSNNEYLTYYAFAHLSILMFYFIMGLFSSIRFVWESISQLQKKFTDISFHPAVILAPTLIICALISNYYIRDFYIGYNTVLYQYIRNSLLTGLQQENINRVHIIGTISPINADVYSGFVTETALNDLGIDPGKYKVTYSASRYFQVRMEESDYLEVQASLQDKDKQILNQLYTFEPTYREYYVTPSLSENDRNELQRIFTLANVIPQSTSSDTLIIDITWTTDAFYKH